MPFGLKVPSKNTLIFSGVAGGIAGLVYSSNKYAQDARTRLAQRVSFLADRPCGVHEMPRKVTVYITAPPGDGLEKSRTWFREYVKPILVAGAVDYEIKEAKSPGQIETSVMEEIVQRRREAVEASNAESTDHEPLEHKSNTGFTSPVDMNKKKSEVVSDGILAIGRNAYREVLSGLAKGCDASLAVVVEEPALEEIKVEEEASEESKTPENMKDDTPVIVEETLEMLEPTPSEDVDHFSLPPKFSPVMYIPHVNIIGWTNIPYRLYMWYADYKRIEEVGKYAVAAVLNQTRPFEERDADLGQDEKKYWIGHETAEVLKENDTPIQVDERIFDKLSTYTSDDLP
ncbi:hypothetical protein INT47_008650 [Mucor saturninus]|uniref:Mitochondrial import inner membrane translocase subunit TIM54 n=1 Tax=Mucor saturninus TaxID=64648 RepID=A0A8H7QID5_9FUNG|nr:hypothetical protein INT47_008650 [Mucor saturninus]